MLVAIALRLLLISRNKRRDAAMAAIGEVDTDAAATEGADITDFEVRALRNCASRLY